MDVDNIPSASDVRPAKAFFMPSKAPYLSLPGRPYFVLPLFKEALLSIPRQWLEERGHRFEPDPENGQYVSVVYDTVSDFATPSVPGETAAGALIRLCNEWTPMAIVSWSVVQAEPNVCSVSFMETLLPDRYDLAYIWLPILSMMHDVAGDGPVGAMQVVWLRDEQDAAWLERQGFYAKPGAEAYWEEDADGMAVSMRTLTANVESVSRAVKVLVSTILRHPDFTSSPNLPPFGLELTEEEEEDGSGQSALVLEPLNYGSEDYVRNLNIGVDADDPPVNMDTMEDMLMGYLGLRWLGGDAMFVLLDPDVANYNYGTVGFVEIAMIQRYAFWITSVGIDKKLRGRRYGTRLLRIVLRLLRNFRKWDDAGETAREFYELMRDAPEVVKARATSPLSPRFVQVLVPKDNVKAVNLFEKFGFFSPGKVVANSTALNFVEGREEDLQRELIVGSPDLVDLFKDLDDASDAPVTPTNRPTYIARYKPNRHRIEAHREPRRPNRKMIILEDDDESSMIKIDDMRLFDSQQQQQDETPSIDDDVSLEVALGYNDDDITPSPSPARMPPGVPSFGSRQDENLLFGLAEEDMPPKRDNSVIVISDEDPSVSFHGNEDGDKTPVIELVDD
jgi:ribosomal protein S18 acetylase RimI-like enzyme